MLLTKSTHILVVDDTSTMRGYLKSLLESLGYRRIAEATNGVEASTALYRALQTSEPIGLVVSDWEMPEMTGIELVVQLRQQERFQSLPFLLVSAHSCEKDIQKALAAQVSGFVVKPFSPETFARSLKKIAQTVPAKKQAA